MAVEGEPRIITPNQMVCIASRRPGFLHIQASERWKVSRPVEVARNAAECLRPTVNLMISSIVQVGEAGGCYRPWRRNPLRHSWSCPFMWLTCASRSSPSYEMILLFLLNTIAEKVACFNNKLYQSNAVVTKCEETNHDEVNHGATALFMGLL
ncbi:uncharacterized protein B0I36DRAFT_429870 [Microdochium trichocladiopsis]|uniref:Uncharacterized protein n=1 Tax=Microdochium trichocladiopsis TaxID=1682393 RepID=A0A9P8YDC0_9PEZI|nr:uncharacterized protein B0I36DRAFT_429870 [Microdochium trichocladiopsis]KAH7035845.1 hypothetical protein B0I36DRAFT_429870 [Microdochium trichocladiopsis]